MTVRRVHNVHFSTTGSGRKKKRGRCSVNYFNSWVMESSVWWTRNLDIIVPFTNPHLETQSLCHDGRRTEKSFHETLSTWVHFWSVKQLSRPSFISVWFYLKRRTSDVMFNWLTTKVRKIKTISVFDNVKTVTFYFDTGFREEFPVVVSQETTCHLGSVRYLQYNSRDGRIGTDDKNDPRSYIGDSIIHVLYTLSEHLFLLLINPYSLYWLTLEIDTNKHFPWYVPCLSIL